MITELIRQHWPAFNGTASKRSGGWNNTTWFIHNDSCRSVLRIYDTHQDKDKILFEHAVLTALQQTGLNYKVPVPILTQHGESLVQLTDGSGKYACLFSNIDGVTPTGGYAGYARSLGEAAGQLSWMLADLNLNRSPAYPPYYNLLQSYPLCSRERVLDFCSRPPVELMHVRSELGQLADTCVDIYDALHGLESFPQQLVHGDLNASNLLLHPERPAQVMALLDFEFCTRDIRVMEPAVILSSMLGEAQERIAVHEFCHGYVQHVHLLPEEVSALPLLMKLRKADVFLHFLSRFWQQTDGPDVIAEQARLLSEELGVLEQSRVWLGDELRILTG